MRYTDAIMVLVIIIQILRLVVLEKRYGKKKGEFLAMTLMLCVIPLALLSNPSNALGIFLRWLMTVAIIGNWIYTLYDFKFRQDK